MSWLISDVRAPSSGASPRTVTVSVSSPSESLISSGTVAPVVSVRPSRRYLWNPDSSASTTYGPIGSGRSA